MNMHKDIWPDIGYVRDIALKSETLPAALRRAAIDVADYDSLVIDTQGSELLVLKGAASLLPGFRYIVVEAADFDAYKGATTAVEITAYLAPLGFRVLTRKLQVKHPDGGRYDDIQFKRR